MMSATREFDSVKLRRVFGECPSGVVAVCALDGESPVGMAVSTFVPVSLDPPLVAVCIQDTSRTWPILAESAVLGVSVLSQANRSIARDLAAKEGDRFANVRYSARPSGAVLIDDAAAWMEGSIHSSTVAGDHLIVVLALNLIDIGAHSDPLVFHRSGFHRIVGAERD
ncbi:flavin reductase family protein [Nocardia sp. NPDC059239]|uniref:flavin reductase family protein n=1 Tax=unclassified Nocardia TaxID=2637762 RepID=UPI0036941D63